MKVIGLAGRAGSGKSAVARWLAQRSGVVWIDLDAIAWGTYSRGTEAYYRLVAAFGGGVLSPSGEINRTELARAAFASPQSRQTLDAIVHPAVSDAVRALVSEHRAMGTELLLVEGALLASSPYVDRSVYDRVLWLEVSEEVRGQRLQTAGRPQHTARGRDVSPSGDVDVVDADGSIEAVAQRILQVIGP